MDLLQVLPLLSLFFLERTVHSGGQESYHHVSTLPTEFPKALGKMLINYALSYTAQATICLHSISSSKKLNENSELCFKEDQFKEKLIGKKINS